MTAGRSALVGASVCAVAAAVVAGIAMIGSPTEARTRRLDAKRVSDLQRLRSAVDAFAMREKRLPSSLDERGSQPGYAVVAADPESARPYEYRVLGADRYELCAVFARASVRKVDDDVDGWWSHSAGRHCYELVVQSPPR